jgi:hypothetical protein
MTTPAIAIFSLGQQEEKNKSTEPPPQKQMRFFLLLISSAGAPFLLPANDVVAHSVYLYRDMLMRVNECNGRPALLRTFFS